MIVDLAFFVLGPGVVDLQEPLIVAQAGGDYVDLRRNMVRV
jgi:hypothetical protein